MRTDLCRRCFKAYVDPLASNRHLLLGKYIRKCAGCQKFTNLVICYFKSEKSYSIICSDNNTIFKESQWFKENRAN